MTAEAPKHLIPTAPVPDRERTDDHRLAALRGELGLRPGSSQS
jgi:hypothetical protein